MEQNRVSHLISENTQTISQCLKLEDTSVLTKVQNWLKVPKIILIISINYKIFKEINILDIKVWSIIQTNPFALFQKKRIQNSLKVSQTVLTIFNKG